MLREMMESRMRNGDLDFGPQGSGGGVADGDKGDVVVSGAGATWTIDPALLSAFMRTVTAAPDAAAVKALLALAVADIGDMSANGRLLVTAADYSAMRTLLGLVIGTDVQAFDAELSAIAGLVSAADRVPYFTGSGTAALATLTSVARTLLAQATQSAMLTTGLGLSANGQSLVSAANYAAMKTLLAIAAADITDASANGRSLITAANYAAMKTLLALNNVDNTSDATKLAAARLGTATNDNAAAGNIGELIEATLTSGSATSLVTATPKTVISINLTAGDWDVSGVAYFSPDATTSITLRKASISLVNNTEDSTPGRYVQATHPAQVPNGGNSSLVGPVRISLAAPATAYLVVNQIFTVSTLAAFGNIRARRVR